MSSHTSSAISEFIPLKKRKGLSEKQIARNVIASARGVEVIKAKAEERKLKRTQILKLADQKFLRGIDLAIRTQFIAMTGTHRLVEITHDKDGKKIYTQPVRDVARIDTLLTTGVYGDDYVILEGQSGDWRAADAFLTRAMGKPSETMKIDVKHTFSLVGLARERRALPSHDLGPIEAPAETVPTKVLRITEPKLDEPLEAP